MNYQLNICHLYPDLMNTYGDMGNIITIVKRCEWRGIKANVSNVTIGDDIANSKSTFDLFFFGGGQDSQQLIVEKDLQKKAQDLKKAADNNKVFLSICGGYQLLQNYFKTMSGNIIKGIGIFDAYTQGSTTRMVQNLLIELNPEIVSSVSQSYSTINYQPSTINRLIGFENHSGKTYLSPSLKPLGFVVSGSGNNGEDKTEGAIYKNAFGSYLHGSLLPKNPHFADFLIAKALEVKYKKKILLNPLDDTIELEAHNKAINRI